MQFNIKDGFFNLVLAILMLTILTPAQAASNNKNTYTEDQFLTSFSGKPQKFFIQKLGAPVKKELSVKPAGASTFMAKAGAEDKNSKPVKVEMWYYNNVVKYDPKRTYKVTEITFVNDRSMNIAFFNNR